MNNLMFNNINCDKSNRGTCLTYFKSINEVLVNNSIFLNINSLALNSALYFLNIKKVTIINSEFSNLTNKQENNYGFLRFEYDLFYRHNSIYFIDHCNFTNNIAFNGPSIYIDSIINFDATISNCLFTNNTSLGFGGTIYSKYS
jgi:predicted outer membrane repeat protein